MKMLLMNSAAPPLIRGDFRGGRVPLSMNFSRSSSGLSTVGVGSLESVGENTPRFDRSAQSGAPASLFIEPQRTNLCAQSNTSVWDGFTNVTRVGVYQGLDGSSDGVTISDTVVTGQHLFFLTQQQPTFTAGRAYTFSIYAKMGTGKLFKITGGSGPFGSLQYANFDLENGITSAQGGSADIRPVGNGWYRCSFTVIAASTGVSTAFPVFLIPSMASTRGPSYTGQGNTINLWGAQTEEGDRATSLILTSGTAATRAADLLSFTIPNGVSTLRLVLDDNSTQDLSVGSGSYTVTTGLNRNSIQHLYSL